MLFKIFVLQFPGKYKLDFNGRYTSQRSWNWGKEARKVTETAERNFDK